MEWLAYFWKSNANEQIELTNKMYIKAKQKLAILLKEEEERNYWFFAKEVDPRIHLIEWDKLLEFIAINLLNPGDLNDRENFNGLGKRIPLINSKESYCEGNLFHFPSTTKYKERDIFWAHKIRNQFSHSIDFEYSLEETKKDITKAIGILKQTVIDILDSYTINHEWFLLEDK